MTKSDLHRLVDELPEESWDAVAVLLRRAQDPVAARLDAAMYDDEELTGKICTRCARLKASRVCRGLRPRQS